MEVGIKIIHEKMKCSNSVPMFYLLLVLTVTPQDLKALVVSICGDGALSLGTTAVDRAWWPDHVRNINRTARGCTDAWREYGAVVARKQRNL